MKVRLSAKLFIWKFCFLCVWVKTNFHIKNFALSLAFIMRFKATRKWSIVFVTFEMSWWKQRDCGFPEPRYTCCRGLTLGYVHTRAFIVFVFFGGGGGGEGTCISYVVSSKITNAGGKGGETICNWYELSNPTLILLQAKWARDHHFFMYQALL